MSIKKSKLTIDSDEEGQNVEQVKECPSTSKQQTIEKNVCPPKKLAPIFKAKPSEPKKTQIVNQPRKNQQIQPMKTIDGKAPFSLLSKTFDKVSNYKGQSSKNYQKACLSNLFKELLKIDIDELVRGYWLCVIKIGPDYEKNELGIGREILTKAIAKSCGKSEKQIRQSFQNVGDLGDVAMQAKLTQKTMDSYFTKKKEPTPLTVSSIFDTFMRMSKCKGNNSATQKENILMKLLMDSKGQETKYIVRWIQGNLKISAAEKTMQSSLISALYDLTYSESEQSEEMFKKYEGCILKAMAEYPNESVIIRQVIKVGRNIQDLANKCKITPGIPCKPMLAKPTKAISEILTRFEGKRFTCQFKYDGLRGQIHYADQKVSIYSRNLENMTEAYPDIVQEFQKSLKQLNVTSFIIDSEIVAINPTTKQILPFQVLSTRSRKAAKISQIEVAISVYAFDVLYYNGPLTHLSLEQRKKMLFQIQPGFSSIITMIKSKECSETAEIDEFLQEAIKAGTEGLMIKDLSTGYFCSRRSWDWVKLKKDYLDKLGDTLDVVPIGGIYGMGKRTGLFGAYLLAVYNSDMEVYETLCKIGTGFSDQVLQAAHKFFSDKAVPFCPKQYRVASQKDVDVWFTPSVVWQIKGADLQISPVYTCGIGQAEANKGIGLRFPRLIKVRDDKKPTDSSNTQFIVDMYKQQAVVQNNKGKKQSDEDDYY